MSSPPSVRYPGTRDPLGAASIALLLGGLLACGGPGALHPPPSGAFPSGGTAGPPVRVDGVAHEWDGVAPAWEADPAVAGTRGVDGPPRPVALYLRAERDVLYLLIRLDREANLQSMPGSLRLALDGDADPGTGEVMGELDGVDRVVDFSHLPPGGGGGGFGQGILARTAGEGGWGDSYGIGLLYAPTWASHQFEVRMALPDVGASGGSAGGIPFRLRLATLDVSGAEVAATPVLEGVRGPSPETLRRGSLDDVVRAPGAHLRVVAWNVGDQGMMRAPEPYLRILAALDPDVLLLDELNPAMDGPWLLEALGRLPDGADWQVVVGTGGGRQRTAVASTRPLALREELARVPWPDSVSRLSGLPMSNQMRSDLAGAAADDLPTVGATLVVEGRTVLFVPLDLMCCGRAGSTEDRARIMAVESIRSGIRGALAGGEVEGVVVAGDFNLVGSRAPLDRMAAGLDLDGGDLVPAPTPRLDGASTMTWRSPGPFPPGQLDHALVSGSTLDILRSFAFDPADLDRRALEALGLRGDDGQVTDHLPVVVDLRVRRAGAAPGG